MFSSIRWRLAASYALLILLSVTLMAALALYIVQRYVERQEGDALKGNAMAVAAQAQRFLEPTVRRIALQELASTAAFLGDARVRILGADRGVIADSGAPARSDEFLWLIPSGLAEIDSERSGSFPFILPLPPRGRPPGAAGEQQPLGPRELMPLLRDLPLGTSHLYAHRMLTPWGRRFVFEDNDLLSQPPGSRAAPPRHFVSTTVPVGPPGNPFAFVEVSSPLSLGGEALRPVRSAVALSGLGSLAIAIAVGLLIGRTISDPLRSLAGTARRMAQGDLTARAAGGRRDEIGQLARQFNGMAESLEGSFRDLRSERDSLKRFVADASHELRTPITALATFNELLQGSAAEDPAARNEFLRESQVQLARLQWITANLLDLSRLDAGIAGLSLGRHAAADILEAALAGHRAPAREKDITLSVAPVDPGLAVSCDRNRVEMALSNLVANAVKFTPAGGSVSVHAKARDGRAIFSVKDSGPGIATEDLPMIFERFYRGRGAGSDGAGLGLAIVQSVARAHGGTVSVQSTPGAGSTFTLE
ncbi:MAG: HAMP domain-containing sensor histidine kinase, partial [Spirochaetia bacterium]